MKPTKTILDVFNESNLAKDEYKSYSSFLKSHLLSVDSETNVPWFVKIITIFGACVGSLLFLGFLLISHLLSSEESMIITGSVFVLSGIAVTYANKRNYLSDSLSLSLSILGQVLLGIGIGAKAIEFNTVCYAGLVVETLIYLFAQSYTHKFLSVILIPACLLGIIWNSPIFEATHFLIGGLAVASVLIWTNELPLQIRLNKLPCFFVPTAYGLVLGLLLTLVLSINSKFFVVYINHWYITSLISFFSLSFLLYKSLCQSLGISKKTFWLVLTIIAILFAPTVHAPGIISSVLIIILGFTRSNRILLTLGIVFLATFIISFYYSLQQTLLTKSLMLMLTGVLFLGIGFAFGHLKKKVAMQ
ncbi:MAG TPA: DUF4401 domain-containing protein [Chitinispirillaceae bacterium]|nr:DUF4401 domain-containing protein [Chitinispirillaceae bacterium]